MIFAGLGFRSAAPAASLAEALRLALAKTTLQPEALATLPHKVTAPALRELADSIGLPIHGAVVAGQHTATQSPRIQVGFDTGSVAEASALAAAGPGAQLVVSRVVSADGMATAAIATGKGLML